MPRNVTRTPKPTKAATPSAADKVKAEFKQAAQGGKISGAAADKLIREVRAETRKVTWPSRKETWITSVMVGIMVIIAMVFFWLVDAGVSFSINQILKLAAGA